MSLGTHLSGPERASAGLRWFVVRVIALVVVLAVPILGTSYSLVSSVSADIGMADAEHAQLSAFAHVVDLTTQIEAVHRDIADHDATAEIRDRQGVDRAFATAQSAYAAPGMLMATRVVWQRWERQWSAAQGRHSIAAIDGVLAVLQEIGNELNDDSPLQVDPNAAVQNLVALVLWQSPRSIVSIRQTADDLGAARGPRLDATSIERIARSRALEEQPLKRLFADIPIAVSIEPATGPQIDPVERVALGRTRVFESRVDRILRSFEIRPHDVADIDGLARRAIDAHSALWRASIAASDRLIVLRHGAGIHRRRIIVALSLLAVLLGTLALTVVGRHMARRDRMELASAKLESDKLRAELHQLSTERALRLQEAQFRSVFENANLGIAIFALDSTIARYNSAVDAILGDGAEMFLKTRAAEIATFTGDREPFTVDELHPREDGSAQWLALTFSGVYDDGICQMVILLLRDTTEEKLLQQGLLYAANNDGLTQIANRSAFERELHTCINSTEPFALMYIDLDKFKPINDTFGHAAGDRVLVATAERLRSALASDDVCARLGGDEFAALVRGGNDRAALCSIATRIAENIAVPVAFGDQTLTVTASIGVALHSAALDTGDKLKLAADRALYVVKERGGNGQSIADHHGCFAAADDADGSNVPVGVAASSVFAPSCVASIL